MAVLQKLNLKELPEVTEVLPDDEIYVFVENAGTFSKIEIPVNSLSTYFHGSGISDKLKEKTNELLKLSADFRKWLNSNYATSSYVRSHYSLSSYFEDAYNSVQVESSISAALEEYATKEYGRFKLAEAKANHAKLAHEYVADYSDELVRSIDLKDDIGEDD